MAKNVIQKFAIVFALSAIAGAASAQQQTTRPSGGEIGGGDGQNIFEEFKRIADDLAERDAARAEARKVTFQQRSTKDLYAVGLPDLARLVEGPPGVAAKTTVWVAQAELSRLPGPETIVHVKGPVTCGRLGCEMIIYGNVGGTQQVIMKTLGETLDVTRTDRVIINRGSRAEVRWRFTGSRFVERRRRR